VCIATRYGLGFPGIESRWKPHFHHPGAHPASCKIGTGVSFQGVKGPERGVDHSPTYSADVKERVELYQHPPPLWAFTAYYRMNKNFRNMPLFVTWFTYLRTANHPTVYKRGGESMGAK